ncbi:hypothetical protein [Dyella thiooxydans]|uniref:hypothetical protein n=1 Tax=Dyella thiooxydans TaxID=445710 RepID=UPI0012FA3EC3|nr:hypothetical protein [Dyella thiooxydans]
MMIQGLVFAFATVVVGLVFKKLEGKYYGWLAISMLSVFLGSIYLAFAAGNFLAMNSAQDIVQSSINDIVNSNSDKVRFAFDFVKAIPVNLGKAGLPNVWAFLLSIMMVTFGLTGTMHFGSVAIKVIKHAAKNGIDPSDVKVVWGNDD